LLFLTTDLAARYDEAVAELVEGIRAGRSGTARTFSRESRVHRDQLYEDANDGKPPLA